MNEWVAAEGSFLDPAVVAAAFTLEGPSVARKAGVGGYVAGLDLGTVNDRTVFSVGHREGDVVVLDRMMVWRGSRARPVDFAEVEEFILAAHKVFRFSLEMDPWQGLDLKGRLEKRGMSVEVFNFNAASKQKLAATLLSAVNSGKLRLYEAEGLRDELIALRLVQSSAGAWSFDHKKNGHDDRAVSLSLMATALLERQGGPTRLHIPKGRIPRRGGSKGSAEAPTGAGFHGEH